MHASASADEPASSASSASRALSRDPVPGIDPDGYPASLALLPLERANRCVQNEAADVSNAEPTTPRLSRANVRSSFSQWDAVTERDCDFLRRRRQEATLTAP